MPPRVESSGHERTPAHAGSTSSVGSTKKRAHSFRLGHMQYCTSAHGAADVLFRNFCVSDTVLVTVHVPSAAQAQQS